MEFGGAEAEDFVAAELQVAVAAHVGGVPGGVGPPVVAGVVLCPVHFQGYALAAGQQEQRSIRNLSMASRPRWRAVLWSQCSQTSGRSAGRPWYGAAVDLMAQMEQRPRRRRFRRDALQESLVQGRIVATYGC